MLNPLVSVWYGIIDACVTSVCKQEHATRLCCNLGVFINNVGDLEERKTEFYGEIYQIRQEMSSCDYELHFEDKDSAEQNGVNGTGTCTRSNISLVHQSLVLLLDLIVI